MEDKIGISILTGIVPVVLRTCIKDEHMLKYNPINDYIYSGNDGGLYVSTDNGDNWTDISDELKITQFYSLGVSQTVQDMVITGSQDNGTFLKANTGPCNWWRWNGVYY